MRIGGLQIRQAEEESVDDGSDVGRVFSPGDAGRQRARDATQRGHIAAPDRHPVETLYREALLLGGAMLDRRVPDPHTAKITTTFSYSTWMATR
jgi:hypothetical protein